MHCYPWAASWRWANPGAKNGRSCFWRQIFNGFLDPGVGPCPLCRGHCARAPARRGNAAQEAGCAPAAGLSSCAGADLRERKGKAERFILAPFFSWTLCLLSLSLSLLLPFSAARLPYLLHSPTTASCVSLRLGRAACRGHAGGRARRAMENQEMAESLLHLCTAIGLRDVDETTPDIYHKGAESLGACAPGEKRARGRGRGRGRERREGEKGGRERESGIASERKKEKRKKVKKRHTGTHRHTHRHTQAHTYTGTHTGTHTDAHRHTQTHTQTHTERWERQT